MSRILFILACVAAVFFAAVSRAADDSDKAPEFPKDARWLQSEPQQFKDLRGKVVILHFFTYGCINCQHNYPVYKNWLKKYDADKLTIIGVHTPEFEAEKDIQRVKAKVNENDLKFPIVIDNGAAIWKAWRTRYWPTIFLIDKKGVVRHYWEGELHLDKAEGKRFAQRIDELLKESS